MRVFAVLCGLAVALIVTAAPAARADTFPFHCVTNNSPADCTTAEAQISMEVTDPVLGDDSVRLTFSNAGPDSSSLTAVYFDDGVIVTLTVVPTPGVAFTAGSASPPDLPGGSTLTPPFVTTENLAADADPSPALNGVNPTESLVLDLDLQVGSTLQDVLDQLASGVLRVGVKVQSFSGGGSESLVAPWCGDGFVDSGEECDDGNNVDGDGCAADCTSEGCGNGVLETGEDCDDGNTAPDDCCSPTCTFETGSCDDGDACNVGETCSSGFCSGGSAPDCSSSGDQCNDASCDPGGAEGNCNALTPINEGLSCDDGDACNLGETCTAGSCNGGSAPDCSSSSDQCNTASCDPAGAEGNCDTLTPANESGSCDDGSACNVGETCTAGSCNGGAPPNCSAFGDPCNAASCDPGGTEGNCSVLTPINEGLSCDDGDACNVGETCTAGSCNGGSAPDCSSAGGGCNTASCDSGGAEGNCDTLTPANEGASCDDSDACNVGETCTAGACNGGSAPDCSSAGGACNTASCDPGGAEGNCDTLTPANEGASCDDGDACNAGATCTSGSCTGGSAPDCSSAGGACNTASCDSGGAEGNCDVLTPSNEGGSCNDGDACTIGDICQSGTCSGATPDCFSGDPCKDVSCDPGGTEGNCDTITPLSGPCDDSNVCTVGETCQAGSCGGGSAPDCSSAGDQCNTASCDPGGAPGNCDIVVPSNEGGSCDDVDVCTLNDECQGGVCGGELCPNANPCLEVACTVSGCVFTPIQPDPNAPPPPADFIFVIDTSVTMKRDLKTWIPPHLAPFPQDLEDGGIVDWRLAIVRTGTNRMQNPKKGPQDPDVYLNWTTDPNEWADAVVDLQNDIRNNTEAGTEGIMFALDSLECRPDAVCNVILYTDEDDDSPACSDKRAAQTGCPTSLTSGTLATGDPERREPPAKGPIICRRKPLSRVCARWIPFQQRTDETAARLIAEQVPLNMVIKSRNKPSIFQYGNPTCTVTDDEQRLDPALTLACLINGVKSADGGIEGKCENGGVCTQTREKQGDACVVDDDCLPLSLQAQLLRSGVCGQGGLCTGGRVGAVCDDDADCAILARAYEIPNSQKQADEFFPLFIQDKIREQTCQAP